MRSCNLRLCVFSVARKTGMSVLLGLIYMYHTVTVITQKLHFFCCYVSSYIQTLFFILVGVFSGTISTEKYFSMSLYSRLELDSAH